MSLQRHAERGPLRDGSVVAAPASSPRASWVNTTDGAARTSAGTKAFLDRFERQFDPDHVLPEEVRAVMAKHARTAHMLQLAERSAAARRGKLDCQSLDCVSTLESNGGDPEGSTGQRVEPMQALPPEGRASRRQRGHESVLRQ